LQDELGLAPALFEALKNEPQFAVEMSNPDTDPFWVSLSPHPNSTSLLIRSVSLLLVLAAPEPDALAWESFGFRIQKNQLKLFPEVLLPYLRQRGLPDFEKNAGALTLVSRFPHPEIAAMLRNHLPKNQPTLLFEYFADLGLVDDLPVILKDLETQIEQFLAKPPQAAQADPFGYTWDERAHWARQVNELQKVLADKKLKAPQASTKLTWLAAQLATAK
jgi:hypothetical protein